MTRPRYPADKPARCLDCGRPCAGQRCAPCDTEHRRGLPRRGVPVKALDGRSWPSVSALTREWGTSHQAAYNHMEWAGDHWRLLREPNPQNIGAQRNRYPQPSRNIRRRNAA